MQPFYVLYFARWCCVTNTKNLLNAYQYTVCLAMVICFPYSSLRVDPETQNVFYNWVKLPIYPSPKTMVTLTSHLGQKNNTCLGKMGEQFPNGKTEISWCITLSKFEKKKSLKKSSTTKCLFFFTSAGWGLFLLLPEELPVRIPCVFRTFFLLKSVWYVVKVLLSLLGKIFDVFGLCVEKNKARIKLYQPIP